MKEMEIFLDVFMVNLLAAAGLMGLGWVFSLVKKNVTIADSLWGLGFVLIAWLTFFQAEGFPTRKILLTGLVTLWGLRLFSHMFTRNLNKPEDPRYGEWRKKHGKSFWIISLFKVFLVQALFQWLISLGVQYGQISKTPSHLTVLDVAGLVIWLAGFVIETLADRQLKRFLADSTNKGKIMNRKLWKYSRHPNYFGESLMWWGIFIMVLSTPWGVWTIVSPILITYTLLKLTGVTLMEETQFAGNPQYRQYIRQTSSFIPWFPKKNGRVQ
jgi:steroid 5-alpha reductase family enzyme